MKVRPHSLTPRADNIPVPSPPEAPDAGSEANFTLHQSAQGLRANLGSNREELQSALGLPLPPVRSIHTKVILPEDKVTAQN